MKVIHNIKKGVKVQVKLSDNGYIQGIVEESDFSTPTIGVRYVNGNFAWVNISKIILAE